MRLVVLMLCLGLLTTAVADQYPKNCYDSNIAFSEKSVVLHTNIGRDSQIYLLRNKLKSPIFLNHQKRDPGASAGWASKLDPDNWSAMMISQKNFSLICANTEERGWKAIPCKNALMVCRVDNFKDHGFNRGATFWLAENDTYAKTIAQLSKRKIELPNNT